MPELPTEYHVYPPEAADLPPDQRVVLRLPDDQAQFGGGIAGYEERDVNVRLNEGILGTVYTDSRLVDVHTTLEPGREYFLSRSPPRASVAKR